MAGKLYPVLEPTLLVSNFYQDILFVSATLNIGFKQNLPLVFRMPVQPL
jgi:hypothetical protein